MFESLTYSLHIQKQQHLLIEECGKKGPVIVIGSLDVWTAGIKTADS